MQAAKRKAIERLEMTNLLDLVLGAQFDKTARTALNDTRAELRRGL